MAVNCTKPRNDSRVWEAILKKLLRRNTHQVKKRLWLTSATSAATVDATGLDDNMKVNDLVYSTGSGNKVFRCGAAPDSDAGTFIEVTAAS